LRVAVAPSAPLVVVHRRIEDRVQLASTSLPLRADHVPELRLGPEERQGRTLVEGFDLGSSGGAMAPVDLIEPCRPKHLASKLGHERDRRCQDQ